MYFFGVEAKLCPFENIEAAIFISGFLTKELKMESPVPHTQKDAVNILQTDFKITWFSEWMDFRIILAYVWFLYFGNQRIIEKSIQLKWTTQYTAVILKNLGDKNS